VKEFDVGPAIVIGDRVVGSGDNLVVAIVANRTIFTIYYKQLIDPIYNCIGRLADRLEDSGGSRLVAGFILSRQKGKYSLRPRTAAPTPHLSLSR
jgi:hypothetical protein